GHRAGCRACRDRRSAGGPAALSRAGARGRALGDQGHGRRANRAARRRRPLLVRTRRGAGRESAVAARDRGCAERGAGQCRRDRTHGQRADVRVRPLQVELGPFAGARRSRRANSPHARRLVEARRGRCCGHAAARAERHRGGAVPQSQSRDSAGTACGTAMKAILSLLTNRWLLSSLGLAALSGAIWLVGPELRLFGMAPLESASARLIAILTAILLWVVNQLRKVLRASKANKGMVEGLI